MNSFTKSEMQTKSLEYANLYSKYEDLQKENYDIRQKLIKVELTL